MSDMNTTTEPIESVPEPSAPLKLDVTARPIEPKGNLLGFAAVKFNDCFVVEDFKILQSDKGLYVGMPSKPSPGSSTGFRDTAKPVTREFRKELGEAVIGAYQKELARLRNIAAPTIAQEMADGAKKAAEHNAAQPTRARASKAKEAR